MKRGISAPYEPPVSSALHLDTASLSVTETVARILG